MKTRLAAVLVLACAAGANAAIVSWSVTLDGPSESPPNASPGTGIGQVDYDTVLHTIRVRATFSGLIGTTTASHIHAATAVPLTGTAGVATQTPSFAGFPLGVTAGVFDQTLDLTQTSSFNPAYVTAHGGTALQSEIDLIAAFAGGRAYLNIHSTAFIGGEIRGFLVPAPGGAALLGIGMLAAARRRR